MLTAEEVARLGSEAFFSRASFLGPALAARVRAQAGQVELRRAGVSRGKQLDDAVRSDEIAWLTAEDASGALSEAVARFEALRVALNEAAWLGLRAFDLQLARYGPGARYVRHKDAFQGDESRRLTAIVYLNDGWRAEHGGQLRLHLPTPLDVEPRLDQLVVFRSEVVEHEVLPARAERWALTAWYSAR